jgi:uncharacterized membrane protein YoaK (UPF0700 family)
MYRYIRILALCALAGYLLAAAFMSDGGVYAGAVKGLLVGALVAWGEWRWMHRRKMELAQVRQ